MADMEGISGICRSSQVMPDGVDYQSARRYLTYDVNACIDGCFAGGAKKVVVRDAHSFGFHFIWDELDDRAEYIQGASPLERMPDIQRFDGLILLGYHAMAGTPQAILEHTMNSKLWQNFTLNGKKCGDDKVCEETHRFLKNTLTVQVKKSFDIEGGILLSKKYAHKLIRETAAKAVSLCKKIKPYKVKSPVSMRVELVSRGTLPVGKNVKIIDGRTYEVVGSNVEEALRLL